MQKTTKAIGLIIIAVMCTSLVLASTVEARLKGKTWIVSSNGHGDFTTIQAAINSANSEDTIIVKKGVYYEHLTIGKTLTLTGENKVSTVIDGEGVDPGSIIVVAANNVVINGFTIRNARSGGNAIWVDGYNYVTISNNVITNTGDGIRILHSHGNMIIFNTLKNNPYTALGFDWSYNNMIVGNTISNNHIGVGASYEVYGNIFLGNVISLNDYGFLIAMYSSKFSQNNIIGNGVPASVYYNYVNTWDCGYPLGGNYWSNYVGADNYRGATQSKAGHDGIGDTPYVIDAQNQDNYPLMKPFSIP